MGLSEMIGKIVNAPLRALGLQICRYPLRRPHNEDLSLRTALGKVLARSVDIGTVIDVGASDGQWSKVAMEYYPRASYCLIEAQEVHVESLEAFKAENPNVDFVCVGEGEEAVVRKARIDLQDAEGGHLGSYVYEYDFDDAGSTRVVAYTADGETAENIDETYTYTFDAEERIARIEARDSADALEWYYLFTYNEEGARVGEEKYNSEDELLSSSTFEFEIIFR